MLELSHLLTPAGAGRRTDRDKIEQLKRDNPTEVSNANWDARRLWLTSYKEAERTVRIGRSRAGRRRRPEFQRRLELSDFFYDVKLLPGAKIIGLANEAGARPVRAEREGEVLDGDPPRASIRAREGPAPGARSASALGGVVLTAFAYWFIFYSDDVGARSSRRKRQRTDPATELAPSSRPRRATSPTATSSRPRAARSAS